MAQKNSADGITPQHASWLRLLDLLSRAATLHLSSVDDEGDVTFVVTYLPSDGPRRYRAGADLAAAVDGVSPQGGGSKTCTACGLSQPLDNFALMNKVGRAEDYRSSACRKCERARRARYDKANRATKREAESLKKLIG